MNLILPRYISLQGFPSTGCPHWSNNTEALLPTTTPGAAVSSSAVMARLDSSVSQYYPRRELPARWHMSGFRDIQRYGLKGGLNLS